MQIFYPGVLVKTNFIDATLWPAILAIIFGVLLGWFESNFVTWFFFAFLCIVGILRAAYNWTPKK